MSKTKAFVLTSLFFLFAVSLLSIRNTSLTMDELAHLPAGYSYLRKLDMRLNPEHPPLLKDLAGLPLLFMKGINFPENIPAWNKDVNGQWDFGNRFLFQAGNPADKMIFWGRIPMILVLISGGLFTWLLGRKFFGKKTGALALLFYCLSPTLIAHGRLVTTDVGIAVAFLASTYFFLSFLKEPTSKNSMLAGVFLGIALLTKFTGIFLLPYFCLLIAAWIFLRVTRDKEKLIPLVKDYLVKFLIILAVAGALIYLVYIPHILNYPAERQVNDIEIILRPHPIKFIGPFLSKLAKITVLRPLVQYLYGLVMVYQRGVGGNTTYFLGDVSSAGWKSYFPLLYVLKVPLGFHLLTIASLLIVAARVEKPFWVKPVKRSLKCMRENFIEFSLFVFIFIYWGVTLAGNLNIGVRHLLPIFPFVFVLVARGLNLGLQPPYLKAKSGFVIAVLALQAVSVFSRFPHFIPYYNELAGGPTRGHLYAVDSNLDWGQDLKRLADWVEEEGIERIYVDYFGGGDAKYYLGNKVQYWWCTRSPEKIEKPAYLAVSATKLQQGRGRAVKGFDQPTNCYYWLNQEELVKKAGYSIFVYRVD